MIAVTGAGGYVGGRLVLHLAGAGVPVRALVRRRRPWLDRDGVEQVVDGRVDAVEGATAVVHLAAPNEVAAAVDPVGTTASALDAVHRVATAATAAGVPRLVLGSTVHVYGARIVDGAHLTEDLRCEPRHPYAVARLAGEHLAATAVAGSGTSLVVLRLTNGVGAPADASVDRGTLLVNDLARSAAAQGRLELHTPGLQWRDFIALADVCRVLEAACDDQIPAGTYNLASGIPRTVREVAELVADAVATSTGSRPPIEAPPPEGAPPDPYVVDPSQLAACGALPPLTPIAEAVAEAVRFVVGDEPTDLSTVRSWP